MKTISRRERIGIVAALVVALLLGVWVLLFPDENARGKPVSLAAARRDRLAASARLAATRAEIAALQQQVDRRIFPGSARDLTERMVRASQAAAAAAGIRLKDLKPLSVENSAGLRRVPLQVTVSSRFPQAVRFLYELERGGSRYQVDQLQLTQTEKQTDQLQIELRLVGYVKGEKGEEETHAGRS